jgi:hypothetical protein
VVQKSYGVVWRDGERPLAAGKLELRPRTLRLDGRHRVREIPYDELAGVRVGRSAEERIDGRPSVVVERWGGGRLTISTVAEAALLSEIVERLTELQLGAQRPRRIADDVDSWAHPSENGYASYLATPGPGDSEGGDIY